MKHIPNFQFEFLTRIFNTSFEKNGIVFELLEEYITPSLIKMTFYIEGLISSQEKDFEMFCRHLNTTITNKLLNSKNKMLCNKTHYFLLREKKKKKILYLFWE